jgi:hypothetical protein
MTCDMAEPKFAFPVFSVPAPDALDFSCSNTCESHARSWSIENARKWAPISLVRPAVPCAPPESYSGLLKAAEWQPTKRRVVAATRKVKLLVQNTQREHAPTAADISALKEASESTYESNTFITETAVCMEQPLMQPLPPAQPQRKRRWQRPKLGARWWRLEHVNGTQRWLLSGSDIDSSNSNNSSVTAAAASTDASPVVAVSLCKSVAGVHTALLKQQCSVLTDAAGSMCSNVSGTNTTDQQSLCDTGTVDMRCNTAAAVDLAVKGLLLSVKGTGTAYTGNASSAAPTTPATAVVTPLAAAAAVIAAAAAATAAAAAATAAAAPQLSPRRPTSPQATSAATRGNKQSVKRAAAAAAAAATQHDDSNNGSSSALEVPS